MNKEWVDKFNEGGKELATEVRLSPVNKGWNIEVDTVEEEAIEREVDMVEIKKPAYDKIYKTMFTEEGVVRVIAERESPLTVKFFKAALGPRGISLYII